MDKSGNIEKKKHHIKPKTTPEQPYATSNKALSWAELLNDCKIICKLQNNFPIVAYICFAAFILHASQHFLFFKKSLQEMKNDCHKWLFFLGWRRKREKGFHFFCCCKINTLPTPLCSSSNAQTAIVFVGKYNSPKDRSVKHLSTKTYI